MTKHRYNLWNTDSAFARARLIYKILPFKQQLKRFSWAELMGSRASVLLEIKGELHKVQQKQNLRRVFIIWASAW